VDSAGMDGILHIRNWPCTDSYDYIWISAKFALPAKKRIGYTRNHEKQPATHV